MKKERELQNCDTVKILMMISVIIYHCCLLWGRGGWFNQTPTTPNLLLENLTIWLGSIHIYTFTFVSGYLFYFSKYEHKKYLNIKESLIVRSKRLLLPYIFAVLFWCIPFQIIYFENSFIDIFKKYFLGTSPSQLWFLIMLFGVFCIYLLISDWFNRCSIYKQYIFLCTIFGVYIFLKFINLPNVFQIVSIVRHIVFFGLGFMFRKYSTKYLYNLNYLILIFLNIVAFITYLEITGENIIIKNIVYLVLNISGILLVFIGVNKYLNNINKNLKIYKILKKYNFSMYIFHQQIIYITISIFNNKLNTIELVLMNFVISFCGSLIISMLLSKLKFTKEIFKM